MRLPQIPVEIFFQADLRVGRIASAAPLDGAREPAYKLFIDFGPLGIKSSSARLTGLYQPADLIGRQVLAVVNFPPRLIARFKSEVLTLGVTDENDKVVLLTTEREAPLGARVF